MYDMTNRASGWPEAAGRAGIAPTGARVYSCDTRRRRQATFGHDCSCWLAKIISGCRPNKHLSFVARDIMSQRRNRDSLFAIPDLASHDSTTIGDDNDDNSSPFELNAKSRRRKNLHRIKFSQRRPTLGRESAKAINYRGFSYLLMQLDSAGPSGASDRRPTDRAPLAC